MFKKDCEYCRGEIELYNYSPDTWKVDKAEIKNGRVEVFGMVEGYMNGNSFDIQFCPKCGNKIQRRSKMKKIRGFEEVSKNFIKNEGETNLPQRGDDGSAGYDLYLKEDLVLLPGGSYLTWTDVKAYMKEDEVLKIYIRSSIGTKYDIALKNNTGIIDASYYENESTDGNIGLTLKNNSNRVLTLEKGSRIAQGIFSKYLISDDDNPIKEKRTGGHGSSGK